MNAIGIVVWQSREALVVFINRRQYSKNVASGSTAWHSVVITSLVALALCFPTIALWIRIQIVQCGVLKFTTGKWPDHCKKADNAERHGLLMLYGDVGAG